VLECDEESRLSLSVQSADIDYSGLPILQAIASENGFTDQQLARFWVYDGTSTTDECLPYLFINGGTATLSGSMTGVAKIRDTVTKREIQSLEHSVTDRHISVLAYHVLNDEHTVATVDHGEDATIKIWSARRSSSHPRIPSRCEFHPWKAWVIGALMIALFTTSLSKTEWFPSIAEISQYYFRIAFSLIKLCIEIAHLVLDAADAAVLGAGDTLLD